MAVGKSSIKRAASAGTKAGAGTKKTSAAAKAGTEVKTSVLTPMNSQEIQVKFLSGKRLGEEDTRRPVRLTEEMPVHLL